MPARRPVAAADGGLAGRSARVPWATAGSWPTAATSSTGGRSRRWTRRSCAGSPAQIRDRGIDAVAVSAVFSPINAEMEQRAAAILAEELPGVHDHPLRGDRPRGAAGARERGDPQRLPAAAWGRAPSTPSADALAGAGIARAAVPDPERRHADGGGLRQALPGADLRLRSHQLDARRGLPLRACRRRWWSISAAPPPTWARCTTASRARRGRPSRSAACGPTSACRTCSASAWEAARWCRTAAARRRWGRRASATAWSRRGWCSAASTLTATDIAVAAGLAEIGDRRAGARPRSRPGRSGAGRDRRSWWRRPATGCC